MHERIKSVRKSLGMTQKQLGEIMNVNQQTIAMWENGSRVMQKPTLALFCTALSVNREWLETGEGEMFVKRSESEQLGIWIGEALAAVPEDARRRLLSVLPQMSVDGIEAVALFAEFVLSRGK